MMPASSPLSFESATAPRTCAVGDNAPAVRACDDYFDHARYSRRSSLTPAAERGPQTSRGGCRRQGHYLPRCLPRLPLSGLAPRGGRRGTHSPEQPVRCAAAAVVAQARRLRNLDLQGWETATETAPCPPPPHHPPCHPPHRPPRHQPSRRAPRLCCRRARGCGPPPRPRRRRSCRRRRRARSAAQC
eukprot:scaffold31834_cov71-Phaeocystis_antarctica.AAC.2